jgi:D-alanine-D-alanine ligase
MMITVLHNADHGLVPSDPGREARLDVERVAEAVASALRSKGHAVSTVGVGGDFLRTLTEIRRDPPDVVFNLCESLSGDSRGEATTSAVLEQLGLTFTGSDALALGLALHKDKAKAILRQHGVATPDWCVLYRGQSAEQLTLPFPVIVKPAREDGSVGVSFDSVATDPEALWKAAVQVWGLGQPALIERYIEGREIGVSFIGNDPRVALPPTEIMFGPAFEHRPRIVSYRAKWDPTTPEFRDSTAVMCDLPAQTLAVVVDAALRALGSLGCRDYGRVDIRLGPDGAPYVIDVNPNCDLHPEAGFARAAAAAGLDYASLISRLVEIARERACADPSHRDERPRSHPGGAPSRRIVLEG